MSSIQPGLGNLPAEIFEKISLCLDLQSLFHLIQATLVTQPLTGTAGWSRYAKIQGICTDYAQKYLLTQEPTLDENRTALTNRIEKEFDYLIRETLFRIHLVQKRMLQQEFKLFRFNMFPHRGTGHCFLAAEGMHKGMVMPLEVEDLKQQYNKRWKIQGKLEMMLDWNGSYALVREEKSTEASLFVFKTGGANPELVSWVTSGDIKTWNDPADRRAGKMLLKRHGKWSPTECENSSLWRTILFYMVEYVPGEHTVMSADFSEGPKPTFKEVLVFKGAPSDEDPYPFFCNFLEVLETQSGHARLVVANPVDPWELCMVHLQEYNYVQRFRLSAGIPLPSHTLELRCESRPSFMPATLMRVGLYGEAEDYAMSNLMLVASVSPAGKSRISAFYDKPDQICTSMDVHLSPDGAEALVFMMHEDYLQAGEGMTGLRLDCCKVNIARPNEDSDLAPKKAKLEADSVEISRDVEWSTLHTFSDVAYKTFASRNGNDWDLGRRLLLCHNRSTALCQVDDDHGASTLHVVRYAWMGQLVAEATELYTIRLNEHHLADQRIHFGVSSNWFTTFDSVVLNVWSTKDGHQLSRINMPANRAFKPQQGCKIAFILASDCEILLYSEEYYPDAFDLVKFW